VKHLTWPVAFLLCCCLVIGCGWRDFGNDEESAGASAAEKGTDTPALSISEVAPVTDAVALAGELTQALAQILGTRSVRATMAQGGTAHR
jgi:hypothetical protein